MRSYLMSYYLFRLWCLKGPPKKIRIKRLIIRTQYDEAFYTRYDKLVAGIEQHLDRKEKQCPAPPKTSTGFFAALARFGNAVRSYA